MKEEIQKLLENAILSLKKSNNWPNFDVSQINIDFSKNEKFGDYSTNLAMALAKYFKKNPMEIAEEIIRSLDSAQHDKNIFEKIEIVAPGYINLYLSKKYFQNKVTEINRLGEKFGNSDIGSGVKVNNEFISANPTGPLHLGNGRGGFYGDSLGKVLKKAGFEVTNEYYINDAGEQAVKFAHSLHEDDQAVYVGEYITELRNKHKEILDESIEMSVAPSVAAVMNDYIDPAIDKMKIEFDSWISEKKDLQDAGYIDKALELLKSKKLVYEKEDALWLKTTDFGDDKDRVLVKSTGEKTYIASDCGYILNKIERKFDKIIEIWGADHHGYISRFKAAAKALGFVGELKFIIIQLVRLVKDGKEVRMSKRTGNVVYIEELIDKVGHDVTRFFFLMYSPDTHMNFDMGLAEERSQKNPVYYVQYAYARICSILRKAAEDKIGIKNTDLSLLTHEKELSLVRELNKFPELVAEIAESYEVHKLPHYAIKLADRFHSFYNDLRVINEADMETSKARLGLVNAVRIVLAETLRLIGVEAPDKM